MYFGPEKIKEKRKEYLMPCLNNFYQNPPQLVRGEMQYLYDSEGKKYLDFFAGVSVMNCGHSNPYILGKVIEQLNTLQHVCNIYLTQPIVELAEKLAKILPEDINNSFFCMSGSEAMDGAMVLARTVTNKRKFIALKNSLHGRTNLTMSATNINMWRTDPFLNEDDFYFVSTIEEIEDILVKDAINIAGFMAEPIQGNAGIITPELDFFEKIKVLLAKHDVLMIIDEVQTGFGRTGKMFAIEHYNVMPDIIAYAKAIGNGIPMAGFSARSEIAQKFVKPSASTLGGNPVSCAAALAVLEYIDNNDLVKKSGDLGEYLLSKLKSLKHESIIDVRGKGLMLGVELKDAQKVDEVLEALKDNGIILGKNGLQRNVLAFQPPLVINKGDIDFLIENLDRVL